MSFSFLLPKPTDTVNADLAASNACFPVQVADICRRVYGMLGSLPRTSAPAPGELPPVPGQSTSDVDKARDLLRYFAQAGEFVVHNWPQQDIVIPADAPQEELAALDRILDLAQYAPVPEERAGIAAGKALHVAAIGKLSKKAVS